MMAWRLSELVRYAPGQIVGNDCVFNSVSTDSRTLRAGLVVRRAERSELRRSRLRRSCRRARRRRGDGRAPARVADSAGRDARSAGRAVGVRARVAAPVPHPAGRRHRQQRQDDHQGAARRDPVATGQDADHARQSQQSHRRAADAAGTDRRASLRRHRDGRESHRRDRASRESCGADRRHRDERRRGAPGRLRQSRGCRAGQGRDVPRAAAGRRRGHQCRRHVRRAMARCRARPSAC